MRSVFLILLLANLLFAAAQFNIFGLLLTTDNARVEQINPEKMRIIRDATRPTSAAQTLRP